MKVPEIFSKPHMQTYLRFAAIVAFVGLVDCLYVLFARKPLPGAAIIPAAVPLLVAIFVIFPMIRASKN